MTTTSCNDYYKLFYCHDKYGTACNGGNSLKLTAFRTELTTNFVIIAIAVLSK